jgi:hypothetical protein
MRIVFCTTCKGRVQHLEQTLPRNIEENKDFEGCRFLVLDYNSPDYLVNYLKIKHADALESGRLVVYSFLDQGSFRMAHAKNMAHRLAIMEGADLLVNMDADNYSAPGFASYIGEHASERDTFLWANAKSVVGRARQGLAGRVVVSRNLFLKVGGYDERYTDWAPEDEDFKSRVRRLGIEGAQIPTDYLYVIPHKDGLRFKEYPHAKPTPEQEAASIRKIRDANHTVANAGNFGCGTVFRNFDYSRPLELKPLPTRIFGIGMHKTATNSLHKALEILGFDSAHWVGPWWAKRIYEEMQTGGRSLTLEQHYALCDLPMPLLFRELDKAYPGSKFILTTRDEEAWLESVRKHWKVNSARFAWDQDCFTHRCHVLLYGRKKFDAEIMLARYRRHNAEVAEHFKGRTEDLLTMPMDRGAGWRELAGFLKVPAPPFDYPREFQAS